MSKQRVKNWEDDGCEFPVGIAEIPVLHKPDGPHLLPPVVLNELLANAQLIKPGPTTATHFDPAQVDKAGRHFDATVRRIQANEFTVPKPPEPGICRECDLRMLCHAEGAISREARG